MRRIRAFVDTPLAPGATVALPRFAAEHLVRVLRLPDGAAVTCFNGDGHDYAGTLRLQGREVLFACAQAGPPAAAESPLRVTLAQCIARGEKMDGVIQKAVELGVAAIVPLVSERTEVRLDAEREARRVAHWRGVVLSACEQCGRANVPDLQAPRALPDWASQLPAGPLRLALAPDGDLRLSELPVAIDDVVAVVGPEGGLSDRDLAALDAAGFRRLTLGPRVLRTETAGPALLAALQARDGDLA